METNLSPLKILAPYLSPWETHDWIIRCLEPVPGDRFIQQVCRECGRGFVKDRSTGVQYAVHVSIFRLHRLSDEVTSRWLSEKCPAECLIADDADRQTRSPDGPFGSTLREMANEPGFRSFTKPMNQPEAARSISPVTELSNQRGRRPSGAASFKSISVSKAQLGVWPLPGDSSGKSRARPSVREDR
jgi:hypothetical protein